MIDSHCHLDDAYYAQRARKLASSPDIDALYIKDPGGLLAPKRAATLIPAIKAQIGAKPLELHSHCTLGLGELLARPVIDMRSLEQTVGGILSEVRSGGDAAVRKFSLQFDKVVSTTKRTELREPALRLSSPAQRRLPIIIHRHSMAFGPRSVKRRTILFDIILSAAVHKADMIMDSRQGR